MIVLRAFVNFELGEQHATEAILGNHAFDGVRDEMLGLASAKTLDGRIFFAALPTGVRHVFLGGFFFAGDLDLLGVDHDDKVARVEVRGVGGLVFSAQNIGDLHGQTAQNSALGINYVPLAFVQIHFRQMRFHVFPIKGTQTLSNERLKSIGVSGVVA